MSSKANSLEKIFHELVRFGLAGMISLTLHLITYYSLLLFLNYKTSNLIALILAKTSAFLLNKIWVFKSRTMGYSTLYEIGKYIIARGLCTGLLDYYGLILLVDNYGFNEKTVKPFLLILVTLFNFVLGKIFVFTHKNHKAQEA